MEKRLIKIANQIVELEKECQLGKNVKENMAKIENIMCTLSILDMLEIDEYITKKKLLTL
jgi:hypothetical protein